METKLKNVETGEVADVFSLAREGLPGADTVKGLVFSRERNRWEEILVQGWSSAMSKQYVYWIPAVPGVDY